MIWLRTSWLLAAVFFTASQAMGTEPIQPPEVAFPIPDRYELVNDYLGVLQISKSIEITKKLQALEKHNGTQIVFLSVPSVGSEAAYAYAIRVAEKWDIGNNRQGNGVLFFLSKNNSYILTGPGIAGAIPDVKIGRIYREIINPHWQREEFSEGVEAGIDALTKAAYGETTAATYYDYLRPVLPTKPEHFLIAVLIVIGTGYAAVLFWLRRKKQRRETS